MIKATHLRKCYKLGSLDVTALSDVSFTIQEGEFVAIVGTSGSGKSSLLNILGCLDVPSSGEYELFGQNTLKFDDKNRSHFRAQSLGFVFQKFHLLSHCSAIENVLIPKIYVPEDPEIYEKAVHALNMLGLGERIHHKPNELSGGEQQRVAIARAILNSPKLLLADEPTGNLDSQNSKMILDYFKKLNSQGTTIIMVTHDQQVANQCQRIIQVSDGKIVSDSKTQTQSSSENTVSQDQILDTKTDHQTLSSNKNLITNLKVYIQEALNGILSRKARSFLSVLGILIGIAAVIAVISVGLGAKAATEEQLSSLGTNVLSISPGSRRQGGESMAGNAIRLNSKDIGYLKTIPEIKRISGIVYGGGKAIYKNKNWNTRILGTHSDYHLISSYTPAVGKYFSKGDVITRRKVAVIGTEVAQELFGQINPIGQSIKINRMKVKVIGLLPQKNASGWNNPNNQIFVPITTAMYRLLGKDYYDSLNVEIQKSTDLDLIETKIKNLLIQKHNIRLNKDSALRIWNLNEFKSMISSVTKNVSIFLYFVSFIALLVGGIGIMNIMLVNVSERTKEIGVRKAMGATAGQIKQQFLIESIVLTLSGGGLGIMLGLFISICISALAGWAVKVSFIAIFAVTLISVAIGIIFGYWPALQASKLHPVEALRSE